MKRRKNIILVGLITIVLSGITLWFLTFTGTYINNKIFVAVDDSLSVNKVRIELGFYSINSISESDSDLLLIENGLKKTLFDGRKKGPFKTICGENDFLIVYNNSYYTVFRHFIPNNFHSGIPDPHKYNFSFTKNVKEIYLDVNIIGPDGEKNRIKLEKISNAGNNFWGKPKTNKKE